MFTDTENTKVKWVNRPAMLNRAAGVVMAHWRKNLEWVEVERWYTKTLPGYAKLFHGDVKDNRKGVMRKFLNDAISLAEKQSGVLDRQ